MLIKPPADIRSSEITDRKLYVNRRDFIRTATGTAVAAATGILGGSTLVAGSAAPHKQKLPNVRKSTLGALNANDRINTWEQITTYNNYYEFGIDKDDPSNNAGGLKAQPWTVAVEGECNKPGNWHFEDILKTPLEERVYRLRCVEAWSMVIPWVGFSISEFIKRCEPTGRAKYVEFITLNDPAQMPGVRYKDFLGRPILKWPYLEALRMDEAMHPLAILAVGLYGEVLPNQDGAPIRLIVPWKYGFKGAKSIVKIRFTDQQPINAWQLSAPTEYGFYANVNPNVDHPRWSQASERRIGEFLKRKTLMFNGYGDQVASLYAGMDLKRNY